MPGVFAVGDVTQGASGRVAPSVGAGAVAVQLIHRADGFLTLWWLMAAGYALAAVIVITRTRGRLGTD
jgi:hypothetical protein